MNQQEHISQLSALFDNQLSAEQAELVIRRALKDPAMRTSWGRYALIGACVRGEPLAGRLRPESDVAARVRIRLAVESARASEQDAARSDTPPHSGAGMLARGAMGMAIAAGVAALSLFIIRAPAPETGTMIAQTPQEQAAAQPAAMDAAAQVALPAPPAIVAAAGAPPSYTTPVDDSPVGQRLDGRMVNYVVAHSEVASSAVRFSPLSTVMNSSEDFTQDTVEMTAAEIGAYR
jgi:negative regulator of sigma E activity